MAKQLIRDIVFWVAVVFFFMFFLPVWGQEFTLLDRVSIAHRSVRLSDIVKEPVPSGLDAQVAFAPEKGDVLFLTPNEVMRRIGEKAVIKGQGVYVYRASKVIKGADLAKIIASLLPKGWQASSSLPSIIVPEGASFSLEFSDTCMGQACYVKLLAQAGDVSYSALEFKAVRIESVLVWKAKRDILKGEVIGKGDIYLAASSGVDKAGRRFFSKWDSPIGLCARAFIPKSNPIERRFVEKRYIVKTGDIVDVKLSKGAVVLKMRARSLENGSVGDTVKAMNLSSGRIFFAKVVGKNLLEVVL